MAGSTSATFRIRSATVLFAVITLAAVTAYASAPATAATSTRTAPASQTLHGSAAVAAANPYEECLTNDSHECVSLTGAEIAIITGTTVGVATNVITGGGKVAIVYLYKKFVGWYRGPGNHTKTLWSGYYEDDGDSKGAGANTNLCLAAGASVFSNITFQPCGANGTVWIEEPDNNGGNYNFSQYWVNHGGCVINSPGPSSTGTCEVMTAYPGGGNGYPLTVDFPAGSGGADYQDFNP
jgi:hypothetical protein